MDFLKKYPLLKHLFLMLSVLIALILFTFFIMQIYTGHGREYILPNLLDKNIEEVRKMKEMNHFELIFMDSIYVENKSGGIILAMDPPPESKVKSGRKIYVTITSYNPEDVEVPDLVDLTIRQAVSLLESHGLHCGTLTFKSDIGRNAVLNQTYKGRPIEAKAKVPRHSSIDLLVGSGIDSTVSALTTIPLIIGKTPQEARRALNISSLNIGKEHFEKGSNEHNAWVIRQSPDYIGRPSARLGAYVEIWYTEEEKENFDKIIKDYVSKAADTTSVNIEEEDNIEDSYNW